MIKTLKKGNFILNHDRFIDWMGLLVDSFFIRHNKKGDIAINYPFLPIIKAKTYNPSAYILDNTTNYTLKEYKKMLNEQIKKIKQYGESK